MNTKITLERFTDDDIKKVIPLLNDWVVESGTELVDEDRIERILTLIQEAPLQKGDRIYLDAKEGTNLVGMVGFKAPCNYMQSFCDTNEAAEVINFYTADHFADPKIADAILAEVEKEVLAEGGKEIVVNRAPRYGEAVDTYFKTKKDYKSVGVAGDFFGQGFDAPVWVKKLARS
jgi:hypothetical protein